MKKIIFDKEQFKKEVKDNVRTLFRKTLEEADQQEIFQAVSHTVKDEVINQWMETQQEKGRPESGLLYVHGIFNGTGAWQ